MPFRARCPHCQNMFLVPDEFVGKKGKCANCQATFLVKSPHETVANTGLFGEPIIEPDPQDRVAAEVTSRISSRVKRYRPVVEDFTALKWSAGIYAFLAWVTLLASVGGGVVVLLMARSPMDSQFGAGLIVVGPLTALSIFATRDIIRLFLSMERNLRIAAESIQELE